MSKNVLTRKIARTVFVLLKKTGGLSLKRLHECIRQAYPKKSLDIVRLSTVLQKATAIGALRKRNNRYTLGSLIKQRPKTKRLPVRRVCNKGRRGKSRSRRGSRRKSRSRRRRRR